MGRRNKLNLENKNIANPFNLELIPNNKIFTARFSGNRLLYTKEKIATLSYNERKFFEGESVGVCGESEEINFFDDNLQTLFYESSYDNYEDFYKNYCQIFLANKTSQNDYFISEENISDGESIPSLLIKSHNFSPALNKEYEYYGSSTSQNVFTHILDLYKTRKFKIKFKDLARPFNSIGSEENRYIIASFKVIISGSRFVEDPLMKTTNENGTTQIDQVYKEFRVPIKMNYDSEYYSYYNTNSALLSEDIEYREDSSTGVKVRTANYGCISVASSLHDEGYNDEIIYNNEDEIYESPGFKALIPIRITHFKLNDSNEAEISFQVVPYYRISQTRTKGTDDRDNNSTYRVSAEVTLLSLKFELIGPCYQGVSANYNYSWLANESLDSSKNLLISNDLINNYNFYGEKEDQLYIPTINDLSNKLSNNLLSDYFFGRQYGNVNTFYSEIRSINGERVFNGVSGKIPKLNDVIYFNEYLPNVPFIITKCEINPTSGTMLLEFTKMAEYDSPTFEQELDNNVVFATIDEDIIESKEIGDFYINRIGNNTYNIIDISEIVDAIETPGDSNYAKDGNNLLEYDGYYWHYVEAKYYNGEEWINTSITANKLSTPTIYISDGNIIWDSVENANEYFIYNNGELIGRTTNNYYDISSIEDLGNLNIKAMSKNYYYLNSDYSNTINISYDWIYPIVSDDTILIKQTYKATKDEDSLIIE